MDSPQRRGGRRGEIRFVCQETAANEKYQPYWVENIAFPYGGFLPIVVSRWEKKVLCALCASAVKKYFLN